MHFVHALRPSNTGKLTALDRGPKSDRPRYRERYRLLYIANPNTDRDLKPRLSISGELHTCAKKIRSKISWLKNRKKTNRRTPPITVLTSPNAVGKYIRNKKLTAAVDRPIRSNNRGSNSITEILFNTTELPKYQKTAGIRSKLPCPRAAKSCHIISHLSYVVFTGLDALRKKTSDSYFRECCSRHRIQPVDSVVVQLRVKSTVM